MPSVQKQRSVIERTRGWETVTETTDLHGSLVLESKIEKFTFVKTGNT